MGYKRPAYLPPPIGRPVKGSKFHRAFCRVCKDPIRVSEHADDICCDCDSKYRGRIGKSALPYHVDIDWGGYCDDPVEE